MRNVLFILTLINVFNVSEAEPFEGREGFHFGLGATVLGACEKEEWNGEEMQGEKNCYTVPMLNLGFGYNFKNQFEISLDTKTLIFASLVGIKAKYYMKDEKDTAFVSLTGGAFEFGNAHTGFIGSYNNIEFGYAYGKKEFSIGIGVPYGDTDVTLVHIGYSYLF